MRSALFAAVFVVVSACGLPPDDQSSDSSSVAPVASHADALCSCTFPTTPFIPTTPVEFSVRYPAGTPLYSGRIASAYTIIFKNSARPYDFVAYGFDVVNNTNVFYVHGTSADLVTLRNQHTLDVDNINIILKTLGNSSISDGVQGQVNGPVPKNPPTGRDAFKIAVATHQANQQYIAQY